MDLSRSSWPRAVAVLAAFTVLAAWYTHPLLSQGTTRIAGDPGDPVLNASILWWNATNVPLTEGWWDAPHFFPARGVTAFTEHLLGVSPFSTPVYLLTGNPLTTYNVALFLTWPLSAFAAYLLMLFVTRRHDAAIVAGLAWGFSPYRLSELGHLQSLSAYWLPMILLGLHGFVAERRIAWLVLFGFAWLMQSLANGYYMVFAPVLIAMWIAYFCSTSDTWRATPALVATWAVASVPLLPIILKYVAVHDFYGLQRSLRVYSGFSADTHSWSNVAGMSWWFRTLGDGEHNLFPGLAAVALVLVGIVAGRAGAPATTPALSRNRQVARVVLWLVLLASVAAIVTMLCVGQVRTTAAGIDLRMTTLGRPLVFALASGVGLVMMIASARAALRGRSPFVFYTAATIVFAILACGPLVIAANEVILDPAPYAWLLWLPGFDRLRVPSRIWMLGTLCIAVTAALAYVRLSIDRRWRSAAFAVVATTLVVDGWMTQFPIADAPAFWPAVDAHGSRAVLLELPLGPERDAAATFRAVRHRRRVVNGVSGYDPPHYAPLQDGLNANDPDTLRALATFGDLNIVVDGAADRRGAWRAFVSSTQGAVFVKEDGGRALYRIAAVTRVDDALGESLPISSVWAFEAGAHVVADGRMETSWQNGPQRPGQWMIADLGVERQVGGVVHGLGDFARDFPRHLAIDVSLDGSTWQQVWDGPTVARAFLAAVRAPRAAAMPFTFPARTARYVRLRQHGNHENDWRVAELTVHAPTRN